MRSISTAVFLSTLIVAPACSIAAPRTIDDCEKIQAADAYNQCLALFGPVARGHEAIARLHDLDIEVAAVKTDAGAAATRDLERPRLQAGRHAWTRHRFARHRHWRAKSAWRHHRHGRKAMMFSVVEENTQLR